MTTTEQRKNLYRNPPAWLNLDALVTPEDLAEIDAVAEDLRAFTCQAVQLAPRIAKVLDMTDRFDCGFDDAHLLFDAVTGIDEIHDLAILAAFLVERDGDATLEQALEIATRRGPGLSLRHADTDSVDAPLLDFEATVQTVAYSPRFGLKAVEVEEVAQ